MAEIIKKKRRIIEVEVFENERNKVFIMALDKTYGFIMKLVSFLSAVASAITLTIEYLM